MLQYRTIQPFKVNLYVSVSFVNTTVDIHGNTLMLYSSGYKCLTYSNISEEMIRQ